MCGIDFTPGELGNNNEKIRLPRFKEIETCIFTLRGRKIELDVLCTPVQDDEFHLAVEVKNRKSKNVSAGEIEAFAEKLQAYREYEKGDIQLQGLYDSFNGFQTDVIAKLHELNINWWDFETLDRLS